VTIPRGRRRGLRRLAPSASTEEATAAGVYGVIVSASVMAATHASTAVATAVAVLVTSTIYWSAERFARVVAGRIHSGHRPDRQKLLRELTTGWEIVSASVLPVIVLVVTRLVGRPLDQAILAALVCCTVLLCLAGWEMGRHGQLTRLERVTVTTVAGMFGFLMIVLKSLLH
jgi:hypothetical protein